MSDYEYWNNYNAHADYGSLLLTNNGEQSATGEGNLKANSAGYSPLWVYEKFGDRLRLLPKDLYAAVFEAIKGGATDPMLRIYINEYSGGATLNHIWVQEATPYLPELG
jgi:hypothetical protein